MLVAANTTFLIAAYGLTQGYRLRRQPSTRDEIGPTRLRTLLSLARLVRAAHQRTCTLRNRSLLTSAIG